MCETGVGLWTHRGQIAKFLLSWFVRCFFEIANNYLQSLTTESRQQVTILGCKNVLVPVESDLIFAGLCFGERPFSHEIVGKIQYLLLGMLSWPRGLVAFDPQENACREMNMESLGFLGARGRVFGPYGYS